MTTKTINLYRCFNQLNQLIYVGISHSAIDRFSQHLRCSEWGEEVRRIDVSAFESREAALLAEKDAIILERPLYNKMHSNAERAKIPACFNMAFYDSIGWPSLCTKIHDLETDSVIVEYLTDGEIRIHSRNYDWISLDRELIHKILELEQQAIDWFYFFWNTDYAQSLSRAQEIK
mgnify:FL=1